MKAEIERLRKELSMKSMRAVLYNEMINVAEKRFYIKSEKSWHQAVTSLHAQYFQRYPIETLCRLFGVSKQAYFQRNEDVVLRKAAQEGVALSYIRDVREKDPGIGGVKLWYMYKRDFEGNVAMGRDRFENLINKYNLKVRKRIRKPRTTDSTHGLKTYTNLIKDFIHTAVKQLWGSDIEESRLPQNQFRRLVTVGDKKLPLFPTKHESIMVGFVAINSILW